MQEREALMAEAEAEAAMEHGRLSRRELLQRGAVAGGVLLGSRFASVPDALAATMPKRGGTLRVGIAGGGSGDTLDAAKLTQNVDFARLRSLYDELVHINPATYEIDNDLAVEFSPNKAANEWTIRLREGVEFHNGKSLTADDLIFTIRRVLNPKTASSTAASIRFLDPKELRKMDKLTVRAKLLYPYALARENFVRLFWVVPVGYDPRKPVGTGPFKFQSFARGQQSVFVRNPNYWRSGQPYVDRVVILDISDDSARVNALVSGQVEAISDLPAAQISVIRGTKNLKLLIAKSGNWRPITMRVDVPPFNDVRVRQAMRLIANRPQMIAQALGGQGVVANDLYAPDDAVYASHIPQRRQDLQRAKSLLKQAGQERLTVELVTAPVQGGLVEACQVLAQQAGAAGVSIKVTKLDPSSFWARFLQRPFSVDYWPAYPYFIQTAAAQVPGAAYNETHWNDPKFNALYKSASRTLDAAKRREIAHEMQVMQHERGGYIIWGFPNTIDAYSSKVAGLPASKEGSPLGAFQFRTAYFV